MNNPLMNPSFEHKLALVTGAGSGMGLATARAFAEAGASVVLADVDEKALHVATDTLKRNYYDDMVARQTEQYRPGG
jgi:NAD(P)-dependent dehydrogenase (short-subunit alcohol dehydrogenase family)